MGVVLFYVGVIGFTLGVLAGSFFNIELSSIVWFLTLSFIISLIWRRRNLVSPAPYLLIGSIFLLLFALGALRIEYSSYFESNDVYESRLEEEVVMKGVIIREPDMREFNTHLYVEIDEEILLVIADKYGSYRYGDRIVVEGVLTKPESFETDLGRTFNYPGYLKAQGANYTIKFAEVDVVNGDEGNIILSTLLNFKHKFMRSVESILPEPHVGLSEGLLLGVKRALGNDLEEVFRKTGIIHIVVLSGYNVMLVVIFVTYIFSFLISNKTRIIFCILAIISFALLVGLSATVVRASIMATFALIARGSNRTYMVMRALMLAGVIMVIINPYLLAYDTGFQLSFVATLGLILLAPHLEKKLGFMPSKIGLREFLTATLSTQIFVMPILLYQIGEFSVVSVIVNVLVLPMVPVSMFLTFITGLLGFVSTAIATLFAYLTYISLAYIISIATWFASLPFASYVVPAFPFWVVVLSYFVIGYVLYKLYGKETIGVASLNGWVIEEEEVLRKRLAAEGDVPFATSQTPIFFK